MPRPLRVFLCHASQDKPAVRELYNALKSEGWIDPWLDKAKILPGQDWEFVIEATMARGIRYAYDIALENQKKRILSCLG
ncbi:MAG: toll/interleukin-1 receptor domain-containing protein [Anaerolineales bacterium]|nr:toll/interleukin-1 receptor domain-containing protein [Anaerolineales bacterium]